MPGGYYPGSVAAAPIPEEVVVIALGDLGTPAPADADLGLIGTTGRQAFVNAGGDWEERLVAAPSQWVDSVDGAVTVSGDMITHIEGHNVLLPDPATKGDYIDLRPEAGKTWAGIAAASDWTPPAGHTVTVSTGLAGRSPVRIVFDGGTTWSVDFASVGDLPVTAGVDVTVQTRNVAGTTQDVRLRRLTNVNNPPDGFSWFLLDGTPVAAPGDAGAYIVSDQYQIAAAEGPDVVPDNSATFVAAWGLTASTPVTVLRADGSEDTMFVNLDPGGASSQWNQTV